MKAAVMRAVGEPLTIEDVELADPGPFEVIVRVAAAGLCHSDLAFMEGEYETPLPTVMGHESAGVVEAVGDRVTYVVPGDHVVTWLAVFCGTCRYCTGGSPNLCVNREATQRGGDEEPRLSTNGESLHQFLNLGSFAERMLVHEKATVKITDAIPLDRAALLGCCVPTGLGAVTNTAKVRPGQTTAVIGCGGVGLSAIQGARLAGAGKIVALDRLEEKLQLALRFGATHAVNVGTGDIVEEVHRIADGEGVDHSFEAIGATEAAELAFAILRTGGTATVIGLIPVGENISIPGDQLMYDKSLQGSYLGSSRYRVDIPSYGQMYLDGHLNLDDMVSGRLDLADVNDGFEQMATGRVVRNVIVME